MEKTKQEIMRTYVNSAIRFADFYNNYAKYFAKNPQKKLQGEKFYGKKIFEIFKQVDMLSETEKNFFYNSLVEGYCFRDSIMIRYVPREFENEVRQNNKKVVVEDRRQEEYKAPPPRFGYVSHKLSSR